MGTKADESVTRFGSPVGTSAFGFGFSVGGGGVNSSSARLPGAVIFREFVIRHASLLKGA